MLENFPKANSLSLKPLQMQYQHWRYLRDEILLGTRSAYHLRQVLLTLKERKRAKLDSEIIDSLMKRRKFDYSVPNRLHHNLVVHNNFINYILILFNI